ncbi:MAG: rhodanese-like domain-containing protein [Thermoanaerobaculia bacterium]
MHPALPLLGLLALSACARAPASEAGREQRIAELYAGYHEKFPEVPDISATELESHLEDPGLVLVDVREARERNVSTLPGALSAEEFEAREDELRGRRVVTYCTIGYRSGLYAERLRQEGWDAVNLEGSILAWTHAGGPLVDPEGRPTHRVHVYGRRWNLAADGYEPVW